MIAAAAPPDNEKLLGLLSVLFRVGLETMSSMKAHVVKGFMGVPQLVIMLKDFSAVPNLRALAQLKKDAYAVHQFIQLESGVAPAAQNRDMGPAMKVLPAFA